MTSLIEIHTLSRLCPYKFPPPMDDAGLVGIGGDLSTPVLLYAYLHGLFPWFNEGDAIAWWNPNPRCVIVPDTFRPAKSLVRTAKKRHNWQIYINRNFNKVIHACSLPRAYGNDTWIHEEVKESYARLHRIGVAFSIEIYDDSDTLAGGLYGLKIGACVFGESMFHHQTDASKLAFWALNKFCKLAKVPLIDCQLENSYLMGLGASLMPRTDYMRKLHELTNPCSYTANTALSFHALPLNTSLSWLYESDDD